MRFTPARRAALPLIWKRTFSPFRKKPTTPPCCVKFSASLTVNALLPARAERIELAIVGENLLDSQHPEFGTSPLVRSPLVEVERSLYGKVTFTW